MAVRVHETRCYRAAPQVKEPRVRPRQGAHRIIRAGCEDTVPVDRDCLCYRVGWIHGYHPAVHQDEVGHDVNSCRGECALEFVVGRGRNCLFGKFALNALEYQCSGPESRKFEEAAAG